MVIVGLGFSNVCFTKPKEDLAIHNCGDNSLVTLLNRPRETIMLYHKKARAARPSSH